MDFLETLTSEVMNGYSITKEEARKLVDWNLDELTKAADKVREFFCGNRFDMCTIINAKSGRCSENCKFCAQSSYYDTKIESYDMLPLEEIVKQAKYNDERGVLRFSLVTSGKQLKDDYLKEACEAIKKIRKETNVEVCVSMGFLSEEQFQRIKEAGATRVHNNLETSKGFFHNVCTTHTFEDKVETLKAARRAGLEVCSGGIMGLGESMEDRIDLAFSLRELGVKSVPVNMLNSIQGTPYENNKKLTVDDMRRIVAIYRFILPDASIRLAGGRGLLDDKGASCFSSGANAAISGDMLTTSGITIDQDMKIVETLGYNVKKGL
ncbi:MAG: biotin synthase BioB [Anaerostipes sp.]|nr:biotin synthase BioB [Anaerostipes sp.]MDD3745112.1 biotin synthase BioB [Anaerostipes sp.]